LAGRQFVDHPLKIVAMQLVERPWGVAAYGAASVKAPSKSFSVASEAVHEIRQVLRQHGIPDSAVERSRLDLKSS
jgi:hypothetical protein